MLPYGKQHITQEDINAVIDVLRSEFITQGPIVNEFEKAIANYCGADFAIAANSATSALHIACLALGVKQGDIVWTSPNSFVASANCARYCQAIVDFIDIESNTGNISIEKLKIKLTEAELAGNLPKVIIPVHFAGQPCDMFELHELSLRYNFKIIEDASHALGASYKNKKIGSCQYSDITVFSFHPVKMITTGEGGMALTNKLELAQKLRLFSNHGITKDKLQFKTNSNEPWYYEQQVTGYNYRMSDINAALGLNQLKSLDLWVSKRNELAHYYQKKLAYLNIRYLPITADRKSSFHLFVILLPTEQRGDIFKHLRAHNIGVQVHYIPIYQQPDFSVYSIDPDHYINTEKYYAQCLSLPLYPELTRFEQDEVLNLIATRISQMS